MSGSVTSGSTTRSRSTRSSATSGTAIARKAVLYAVLAALAAVFSIPMLWLVSTSLKAQGQVFAYPPVWIPNPVRWANYLEAMDRAPLLVWLANTAMITILAMTGTLLSSSLVAFGFARLRFPGRRLLFYLLLSTMMLPDVVTLVPQFVLFRSLGWVDTFAPLVVPAFLGGGAFNVFLVRQFYLTIPRDFDEAARLDGASNLRIWWHIMLPLSRPVLVAVGIFSFVYHWNDFLLPLIYLQSEGNKTLALGLRAFISPTDASWNISMAASMFLVVPVLIVFFVAQRQFIRGVVMTGISGR
ncbi:carbohydrate ABC transporter permease [Actinopolymorpha singaporensis]|uniref:Carbohydrate ABC transporter membrane protein 2, CUT1 family n=1 Tax=Actinopolymorpha singaporensis TaxID=117157 RepID=A0A1H1WGR7_9ACTN|nr:carbohydrate ABC transporter permease [Actinopolymorpha singaporensis]SDS95840.1 carbohydrate ABC transporter membrane protein 2, CUT1 family [Actinopolymorpha singaporensis]